MRLLIALHDYLPLHKGGSEIHAHQTAVELRRRGHDVTSVFTERDLSAEEGTLRRGELDGVPTIELVHQREYGDVRETWRQPRALAAFRDVLAEQRPDVVHFHHLALWGPACVRAAKDAGARVVVTVHDYFPVCDAATLLREDGELCTAGPTGDCTDCLRRHPLRRAAWGAEADGASDDELWARAVAERLAAFRDGLRAADVVISPSRFLQDMLVGAGLWDAERAVVMKAGYPGPVGEPRTRDASRPLRVGYVGGIYPSKGVHVLVQAFGHLADAPAELHVHGHLDWFPGYVAELRAAADGHSVHLHGPFDPDHLDRVLAGLDALVVPSIWFENMPITIQEAFRTGLPVVATDLGGMREAVRHDVDGLLFPRGDAEALAAALRRLATDAPLYDRLAAGRPAVPTLSEIVDRLERTYRG
jgi:glycosyltransferase involved in cell wall biosynthesis